MDCSLMFRDARRAKLYGKPMTLAEEGILVVSDPLVHVEFRFSGRYHLISQSATMQGNFNGCRFMPINYSHPERWVEIILPMSNYQEDCAFAKGQELDGKGYDKFGVFSLVSNMNIIKPNPELYWCSEDVLELCKAGYGWADLQCDKFNPLQAYFEVLDRLKQMKAKVIG